MHGMAITLHYLLMGKLDQEKAGQLLAMESTEVTGLYRYMILLLNNF